MPALASTTYLTTTTPPRSHRYSPNYADRRVIFPIFADGAQCVIADGQPATVGVGLMVGVFNRSMGIVGPPVILFYFSSPIGVVARRASIIAYFIGADGVGTVMLAAKGLLDANVLWRTAIFLPVLIAGVVVGNRGFIVRTEDGATSMPRVRKEPLLIDTPMSPTG